MSNDLDLYTVNYYDNMDDVTDPYSTWEEAVDAALEAYKYDKSVRIYKKVEFIVETNIKLIKVEK